MSVLITHSFVGNFWENHKIKPVNRRNGMMPLQKSAAEVWYFFILTNPYVKLNKISFVFL